MRSSIGGWVENSAMKPRLVGDAEAADRLAAARPARGRPGARSALIIGCGEPRYAREPASARNSRWRENQATMMEARMPNTIWHDDHGDEEARARAALGAEHGAVDEVADDARQEDHEGVDHALDERQRHHVAVGDVRDLVAEHRLDFLACHRLQQAGGDGDQRGVPERAGGERIGLALVDRHFGHADAGLVGEPAHGLDQPGLGSLPAAR